MELAPSQILRFSLTGSTVSPRDEAIRSDETVPDRVIRNLFGKWAPNTPPPPEFESLIPGRARINSRKLGDLLEQNDLMIHKIQIFIEQTMHREYRTIMFQAKDCAFLRRALPQCERSNSYSEILCTINGFVARLESMHLSVSPSLHILGMRYACLSLSAPALYYHLRGYRQTGSQHMTFTDSLTLVHSLLHGIRLIETGDPGRSLRPILRVVTGEGSGTQGGYRLHDCLSPERLPEYIFDYLLALIKLKSRSLRGRVLSRSLAVISRISPFPVVVAYSIAMALVGQGKSNPAATYLSQISQRCGNSLPGILKFRDLPGLLADETINGLLPKAAGERRYMDIVRQQIYHMERILGIQWLPEQSVHASVGDMKCVASDQPLLTIDGTCAGFDSDKRLIDTLIYFGRSNKLGDLARIADLLHEHDGTEIRVSLRTERTEPYELAWRPQCSPIEFSNALPPRGHDPSVPWSPSALGLLRGRHDSAGVPQENDRTLHLMQLGYLVMRSRRRGLRGEVQPDDDHPWHETGHIVTWDRVNDIFLIVFMGKGHGKMNPGLPPSSQQPPPGLSRIRNIHTFYRDVPWRRKFEMPYSRFHFDVDPVVLRA